MPFMKKAEKGWSKENCGELKLKGNPSYESLTTTLPKALWNRAEQSPLCPGPER